MTSLEPTRAPSPHLAPSPPSLFPFLQESPPLLSLPVCTEGVWGGVQSEMTDLHCQHSNYTTPVSTLSLTDKSSRGSQETSSPDTRLTPPLPVPPSPLHRGHWQESGWHHRQEKTLHPDKMRRRSTHNTPNISTRNASNNLFPLLRHFVHSHYSTVCARHGYHRLILVQSILISTHYVMLRNSIISNHSYRKPQGKLFITTENFPRFGKASRCSCTSFTLWSCVSSQRNLSASPH